MESGSSNFGLTKEQLHHLVDNHGREQAVGTLPPYDGIDGVLKKLHVSYVNQGLNGNNKSDLDKRRKMFGRNEWSRTERDRKATVLRNGNIQEIPIIDVVVGDVCPLKPGDKMPADGLVLESNGLKVDESSMTGELEFINRRQGDIIFCDTDVKVGTGKVVIIGVGIFSSVGTVDLI